MQLAHVPILLHSVIIAPSGQQGELQQGLIGPTVSEMHPQQSTSVDVIDVYLRRGH